MSVESDKLWVLNGQRRIGTRKRPVLRRYGELAFVALGGAAVLALTATHWIKMPIALVEYYRGAPYAIGLSGFLLLTVLFWAAGKPWSALLGVRHFLRYPPGWVAAFVGATAIQAFWTVVPESRPSGINVSWESTGWCAGITGALLAIGSILDASLSHLRRRGKAAESELWHATALSRSVDVAVDLQALQRWVHDDAPIRGLGTDHFDLRLIADRIVRRLSGGSPLPTIGVVGRLGSGKSSLRELVTEGLCCRANAPDVIPISLWQYQSTEAAAAGVLDALVKQLSQHINTGGLTGLSSQYIAAIEGASGLSGTLLQSLLGAYEPAQVLRRIEPSVAATGLDFILWVEDLERFADGEDRRGPIRALLYQLDQLPRVSVILATTTLDESFDIEKLARYVERIPDLGRRDVFRVLRTFRAGSLPAYVPESTTRARRPLNFDLLELDDFSASMETSSGNRSVSASLATVCRTPRQLKQALRHCSFVWASLRGEIDFDDVLIMSMLRETSREIFSLVDEYSASLRTGEFSVRDNDKEETPFRTKLGEMLASSSDSQDILRLIDFVFPKNREEAPPQGMRSDARNYWQRFQAITKLSETDRDQVLISLIEKFKRGGDEGLAEHLVAGVDTSALRVFAETLTAKELRLLLSLLVKKLLAQNPIRLDDERYPVGLTDVWALFLKRRRRGDEDKKALAGLIVELIGVCLPAQMFLAEQLVHWFADYDKEEYALVSQEERENTRAVFHSQLREHFGVASEESRLAENLIAALTGAPEVMLLHAVWGVPKVRNESYLRDPPFEGWESFRDTLLAAAEISPEVMLGPISWLVTKHLGPDFTDGKDRASFQEGTAERLFGVDRLLAIFARGEASTFRIAQTDTVYRCVKRAVTDPRIREGAPYAEGDRGPQDAEFA